MADLTNADSNPRLSVDTHHRVSKDVQGSPSPLPPLPLSPQWLLPKPGEIKHGVESHISQYPGHTNHSDFSKTSRNDEEFRDTEKRRDAFKPPLHDVELDRRDHWRDEERDTNSAMRKDRWKEVDNELGDGRKMERWMDASGRHSGEARRNPSDRWNDSSSRESKDNNHDHRRESKWNTRWGPDDKESESWREKWQDSSKDGEAARGKTLAHHSTVGKEEKEGDQYRPWRPSSLQNRGRGESLHHQSITLNKQAPTFSYGRGRVENSPPTFSAGRGKVIPSGNFANNVSSHAHSLVTTVGRDENALGEYSPLRYSRTKLLDIYRITDFGSRRKPLEEFVEVPPSLTQSDPLEPLALCAPNPEEQAVMKGIEKGDVVSSGAPSVSKEGSTVAPAGRNKFGSREDLPSSIDDYKEQNAEKHAHIYGSEPKSELIQNPMMYHEKPNIEGTVNLHSALLFIARVFFCDDIFMSQSDLFFALPAALRSNSTPNKRVDVASTARGVGMQGSSIPPSTPWRSQSLAERMHVPSHERRDFPAEIRSRTSEVGRSNLPKDRDPSSESISAVASSYHTDESKWHTGEGFSSGISRDSVIKRQLSEVLDRECETRKSLSNNSPEELSLYYKDPQGQIQGPFSGSDLIGWFEAGYFGIDLQVRLASASPETPFSQLGDVMPHLRAKARPPPGFSAPKQGELAEAVVMQNVGIHGMPLPMPSEIDGTRADPRSRHESANEAENRFLESLMSSNINSSPLEKFAFSEGIQGQSVNKPAGIPMMGMESGNDLSYLLAQKATLDRQNSLPNPHSYWTGRDAAPMVAKNDVLPEATSIHSKLLSSMSEGPHPVPLSQNMDLSSILQGVVEKPSSSVNNGVPGWSNFPVQGGLDMRKDNIDVNHGQHFLSQAAYGVPQQRMQQQMPPSLTNLSPHNMDHPSAVVSAEKLLASGLSQDPQMLSLLQQQYLLSQLQLHSQSPLPMQMSLLDKLLLLKQQQKQEQQQQLLLQQQQHLLSQVLSEHQSHQRFSEPYGHLQTGAMPTGNDSIDHLAFRPPHELLHTNLQMPVSNLQGGISAGYATMSSQVSHDMEPRMNSEGAQLHLPHQMFVNPSYHRAADVTMEEINENQQNDSLMDQAKAGHTLSSVLLGSSPESFVIQKQEGVPDSSTAVTRQALEDSRINEPIALNAAGVVRGSMQTESSGVSDFLPNLGTSTIRLTTSEVTDSSKVSLSSGLDEMPVQRDQDPGETSLPKEERSVDLREGKKGSDKKSKKQKNAKAHVYSEQTKGASGVHPLQQLKQVEVVGLNLTDSNADIVFDAGELPVGMPPSRTGDSKLRMSSADSVASEVQMSPSSSSGAKVEALEVKDVSREADHLSMPNSLAPSGHRAWKPAPSVKAKSLLEIQQEEQKVAQMEVSASDEAPSVNFSNPSLPWTGVVASSEAKRESHQGGASVHFAAGKSENLLNSQSKKSQLHDLLAEEVLAKSDEKTLVASDSVSKVPSAPIVNTNMDSAIDEDEFIQAKDSKKNRKKSVKGKGVAAKALNSIPSVDIASSPIEKGKSCRQVQQEKEVLPPLPLGPSLGDFVLWKGEQPASPLPSPAWSTESAKQSKPTSLRDIQKEQEKRVAPVQHQAQSTAPQKVPATRVTRGSGSWSLSGSSPSKAASPIQINSGSTISKPKGDDDLFWGPIDQSKQETKQPDFPSLSNAPVGASGYKNTPSKGILGGLSSRQRSLGSKPVDYSLASSPAAVQSSPKGRMDAATKHAEAMDFRAWCETETAKLTGSKDTSILEFCLKQSTSEAQTLLIENFGSLDPDHKFIDKVLNYKELLSADVLDIAFQARSDRKVTGLDVRGMRAENTSAGDPDQELSVGFSDKGGGKKRGKKGKKVSPAVLGFNVVSTRIMMGEIQTIEE
ncbi:hypothetical protein Sjap_016894 [Stephania japonica]|uniref:GYF domain-containing protein n=1 Tax=Stephania japonica TaxID=461633 RepID=A0AAP0NJ83_9MAGN